MILGRNPGRGGIPAREMKFNRAIEVTFQSKWSSRVLSHLAEIQFNVVREAIIDSMIRE